jgi:hypothetical protein
MRTLLFTAALFSLAPLAHASQYRCVNEAGNVMNVSKSSEASEFYLQDENSTYQCTLRAASQARTSQSVPSGPVLNTDGGGNCKGTGWGTNCG